MRKTLFLLAVAALAVLVYAEKKESTTGVTAQPDSIAQKIEMDQRQEWLLRTVDKLTSVSECDTVKTLTQKEVKKCKKRYFALHPEEKWGL